MRIQQLRNIIAAAMVSVGTMLCAVSPELPRTYVNGKEYYYYDVRKGESIYKVAKQMGVTTSEITAANPQALEGLRAGMRVYIPVGAEPTERVETVEAVSEKPAPMKPLPKIAKQSKPTETVREVPVAPAENVAEAAAEDTVEVAPVVGRATVEHKVKRGESL